MIKKEWVSLKDRQIKDAVPCTGCSQMIKEYWWITVGTLSFGVCNTCQDDLTSKR